LPGLDQLLTTHGLWLADPGLSVLCAPSKSRACELKSSGWSGTPDDDHRL